LKEMVESYGVVFEMYGVYTVAVMRHLAWAPAAGCWDKMLRRGCHPTSTRAGVVEVNNLYNRHGCCEQAAGTGERVSARKRAGDNRLR